MANKKEVPLLCREEGVGVEVEVEAGADHIPGTMLKETETTEGKAVKEIDIHQDLDLHMREEVTKEAPTDMKGGEGMRDMTEMLGTTIIEEVTDMTGAIAETGMDTVHRVAHHRLQDYIFLLQG